MLFDSDSQPSLKCITIKSTTPGGSEAVVRVPLKLQQKSDCPIHKLAARAILGDLERGEGWMHVGPNRLRRHSEYEEKLVRQEGEAIGCKWSLVSKWTSLFAVEEPYFANENNQDPFLDTESVFTHDSDGDMDLLRPRGPAGRRSDGQTQTPPALDAEQAEESEDDDEDSPSDSDASEGAHDSGSDSNDEGDNRNGRGGDTAGRLGTHLGDNHTDIDSGGGLADSCGNNRGSRSSSPQPQQESDDGRRGSPDSNSNTREKRNDGASSPSLAEGNQRSADYQERRKATLTSATPIHEVADHNPQTQTPPLSPPRPQPRPPSSTRKSRKKLKGSAAPIYVIPRMPPIPSSTGPGVSKDTFTNPKGSSIKISAMKTKGVDMFPASRQDVSGCGRPIAMGSENPSLTSPLHQRASDKCPFVSSPGK
jgi:hypothetical protein